MKKFHALSFLGRRVSRVFVLSCDVICTHIGNKVKLKGEPLQNQQTGSVQGLVCLCDANPRSHTHTHTPERGRQTERERDRQGEFLFGGCLSDLQRAVYCHGRIFTAPVKVVQRYVAFHGVPEAAKASGRNAKQ